MTDIEIDYDNATQFGDIVIENSDAKRHEGLESAVLISLFTDRRDNDVGGYWCDAVSNISYGSRLWLLDRSKANVQTVRDIKKYAEEALEWLTDEGIASNVDVAVFLVDRERINMTVSIARGDEILLEQKYLNMWDSQFEPPVFEIAPDLPYVPPATGNDLWRQGELHDNVATHASGQAFLDYVAAQITADVDSLWTVNSTGAGYVELKPPAHSDYPDDRFLISAGVAMHAAAFINGVSYASTVYLNVGYAAGVGDVAVQNVATGNPYPSLNTGIMSASGYAATAMSSFYIVENKNAIALVTGVATGFLDVGWAFAGRVIEVAEETLPFVSTSIAWVSGVAAFGTSSPSHYPLSTAGGEAGYADFILNGDPTAVPWSKAKRATAYSNVGYTPIEMNDHLDVSIGTLKGIQFGAHALSRGVVDNSGKAGYALSARRSGTADSSTLYFMDE